MISMKYLYQVSCLLHDISTVHTINHCIVYIEATVLCSCDIAEVPVNDILFSMFILQALSMLMSGIVGLMLQTVMTNRHLFESFLFSNFAILRISFQFK